MVGYLEAATGGSLFFDGIGDLTVALQAELLRFLDEECLGFGRNAEARIVAAAHQDLQAEVAHGRFRDDLFTA
jgi:NtrC-family two-component system response regulator AlgB